MPLKTIRNIDVAGKRVLVRVDYNVPMKDGKITDTTRIEASLPTLLHLLGGGGRLVLMSHLGRPKGEKNPASQPKSGVFLGVFTTPQHPQA